MTIKMFQDIRGPRRSLREVLPARQIAKPERPEPEKESFVSRLPDNRPDQPRRKSSGRPFLIVLIILILAGGAAFALSNLFARAETMVKPKTKNLAFQQTTVTYSPVETVTLPALALSATIKGSGTETVNERATGQLLIANRTSVAQRLIKTTRFQSAAGLVYRTAAEVTVPPGKTASVAATADAAGDKYNGDPGTLTLPAYAHDPRFTKLDATAKAGFSGGASGTRPAVSAAEEKQALDNLHQTLSRQLVTQARFQIPANFVLFDDGVFVDFNDQLGAGSATTSTVTLRSTASAKALLFDTDKLAALLFKTNPAKDFNPADFSLPNLEQLTVTLVNKAKFNFETDKTVSLTFSGTTTALAKVDIDKLKAALAGKSRAAADEVFQADDAIAGAEIIFHPPWLTTIPKNPDANEIKLVTE